MKNNKIIPILALFCLMISILFGCRSSVPKKPEDIRQDIWDKGIEYFNLLKDSFEQTELVFFKDKELKCFKYEIKGEYGFESNEMDGFLAFAQEYDMGDTGKEKNLTINESKFIKNILSLGFDATYLSSNPMQYNKLKIGYLYDLDSDDEVTWETKKKEMIKSMEHQIEVVGRMQGYIKNLEDVTDIKIKLNKNKIIRASKEGLKHVND